MFVVESLFNPTEFIPINKIDYKHIYLNKYYDSETIKKAISNELNYSLNCIDLYKKNLLKSKLDDKWVIKKIK